MGRSLSLYDLRGIPRAKKIRIEALSVQTLKELQKSEEGRNNVKVEYEITIQESQDGWPTVDQPDIHMLSYPAHTWAGMKDKIVTFTPPSGDYPGDRPPQAEFRMTVLRRLYRGNSQEPEITTTTNWWVINSKDFGKNEGEGDEFTSVSDRTRKWLNSKQSQLLETWTPEGVYGPLSPNIIRHGFIQANADFSGFQPMKEADPAFDIDR